MATLFVALSLAAPTACTRTPRPAHPEPSPRDPEAAPTPEASRAPATPVPAFALYTSEETYVFPYGPSGGEATAVNGPGLWLLDADEVVLYPTHLSPSGVPAERTCPCGSRNSSSCIASDIVDSVVARWPMSAEAAQPQPGLELGDIEHCRCFFDFESDEAVGEAIARRGDAGELGICPTPVMMPVALFGGVLYRAGDHNTLECNGLNIYDVFVDWLELTDEPSDYEFTGEAACYPGTRETAGIDLFSDPCPTEPLPEDDEAAGYGNPDCDLCEDGSDGEVLFARSGLIYEIGLATRNVGGDATYVRSIELTPESCPTPFDTCGVNDGLTGFGEDSFYWIATDGSAALVPTAHGVSVFRPNGPPTSFTVHVDRDIIGVRHHDDAGPLLARLENAPDGTELMELVMAQLGDAPEMQTFPLDCDAEIACEGDLSCRDDSCVPPCGDDDDCIDHGLCSFICGDGGFCAPRCGENDECPPARLCQEGHCRAAEEVVAQGDNIWLAPQDRGFEDTEAGAGWGNRCFQHIRAERHDSALAACVRGLRAASAPNVRGAIIYNMGRVYEEWGSNEVARRLYQRSLEIRPGNRTVRARLDALLGVSDDAL